MSQEKKMFGASVTEEKKQEAKMDDGSADITEQSGEDLIATLTADNQALKFSASQQAQNAYLVRTLAPSPTPAYIVPNPYAGNYGYNNCCCACAG